ncbi:DUF4159 domain-containing protein [Hyphococcus sp.]|uniref:DUF4159 domain-containing protein n=1 Tax=Hyphococcus sp. TaxID=2038636 RepID=UPI0020807690|nr:MAG: LytTR family transcriptional regulator [Marinicaulis sp.]
MGALSFTSPFILLALGALPLIWLLLRATPPSPKRERFPAFIILRQLTTAEETPDRTPWWLLLLRLLLAAMIILALAGPVLNAPAPGAQTGPLLLVVDDSWAAAQHWQVRRDAMREATAQAAQSDRQVFLLTTAPQTTPPMMEPMSGEAARAIADALTPTPFAADRNGAATRLAELDRYFTSGAEIRWISDGLAGEGDATLAAALAQRGDVTLLVDARAPKYLLRPLPLTGEDVAYRVERLDTGAGAEGVVVATARDGRELARSEFEFAPQESAHDVTLNLPLALVNEMSVIRLQGVASAGAVHLTDARDRRALIGLARNSQSPRDELLTGDHYIKQALKPYAAFLDDDLSALLESDASVIVLDDVGRLRPSERDALSAWVERGGVLIRFAGPVLAEAAQDGTPELTPAPLRGGGRAFGGALTWDTPQRLDVFAAESPFAGLAIPDDVFIRRQVLAEPGGETTTRTWARLADGTPLVTGLRQGAGVIALFHVTATPDWSDLPLSGLFIEMLRRLTFLSSLGPEAAEDGEDARYAPLRALSGEGRLSRPDTSARALTATELAQAPSPERAPGFYGAPEASLALNAVSAATQFAPLAIPGLRATPYIAAPPVTLGAPLILAAFVLLLVDGLLALVLSGRLPWRSAAAVMIIAALTPLPANNAMAQPLDAAIETKTAEAALTTRLAYIASGDPAIDRLTEQGLAALSRELYRRTAIEPAPPERIDPDTDDLAVYSFLYWPVAPSAETPSDAALANIENFMHFGGLLLIDTRDDERAVGAGSTPEGQALQRILGALDIPPLTPVDDQHVLSRSFYLLNNLYGRTNNNPVWVEADSSGSNDDVTSIIIGGRDWAGAWAADSFGRPVRPMGAGGPRTRELAYRAGVNMVMVAFTGNYKSDQVHTPILLERLGK